MFEFVRTRCSILFLKSFFLQRLLAQFYYHHAMLVFIHVWLSSVAFRVVACFTVTIIAYVWSSSVAVSVVFLVVACLILTVFIHA